MIGLVLLLDHGWYDYLRLPEACPVKPSMPMVGIQIFALWWNLFLFPCLMGASLYFDKAYDLLMMSGELWFSSLGILGGFSFNFELGVLFSWGNARSCLRCREVMPTKLVSASIARLCLCRKVWLANSIFLLAKGFGFMRRGPICSWPSVFQGTCLPLSWGHGHVIVRSWEWGGVSLSRPTRVSRGLPMSQPSLVSRALLVTAT